MEPAPSLVSVCRYSPMVALPVRSISSRVMTCTGDAVSMVARGMLEPVTVILSSVVAFSCAIASGAAMASASALGASSSERGARVGPVR
ncbi:hypothetical protein D3C81_1495410 [compost metagenome]